MDEEEFKDAIASSLRKAWLLGFRTHQTGPRCPHGYGPGDHHWETGTCLAEHTFKSEMKGS